jgi:hypothetical protein
MVYAVNAVNYTHTMAKDDIHLPYGPEIARTVRTYTRWSK